MLQTTIDGTVELKDVNVRSVINGLMDRKPATYMSHRTMGLELMKNYCPGWNQLKREQQEAILFWFDKSPDACRRAQEKREREKSDIL